MNTRSCLALRALLLILLLAVQGLGHAHQLDHFANRDGSPCAACSAGSSLEHAVVDTVPARTVTPAHQEQRSPAILVPAMRREEVPLARAPPLSR